MTTTIFDKTDKGRDEIATRVNHLPARLRTLLLLVDGKRDTAELMVKVAGLGLDEKSLVELLDGDFIQIAGGAPPIQAAPVPQESTAAPVPQPVAATAPFAAIEVTAKPASIPAAPSAPATASHIHCCTASPGLGNVGVFLGLTGFPSATSGTYSNTFTLTSSSFSTLLTGANAGEAYVNVHDSIYPGGEIRGFLAAVPEPGTYALMLAGLAMVGGLARNVKRA